MEEISAYSINNRFEFCFGNMIGSFHYNACINGYYIEYSLSDIAGSEQKFLIMSCILGDWVIGDTVGNGGILPLHCKEANRIRDYILEHHMPGMMP